MLNVDLIFVATARAVDLDIDAANGIYSLAGNSSRWIRLDVVGFSGSTVVTF